MTAADWRAADRHAEAYWRREAEAEAREAAAAQAAIDRRSAEELAAARRLMSSARTAEQLKGYRAFCDAVARRHGFRVVEQTRMPAGAVAYFDWRTKTAIVPPIVNDETFAVRLHEFGHGIAGECSNVEPHRRNPSVREWWHCLACETRAWAEARALLWFGFTMPMFQHLRQSLQTYRRTTPAGPEARAALDRLMNFTESYARPKQRVVEQTLRQQRVEESLRPAHVRVDEMIRAQREFAARMRRQRLQSR